MASVLKETAGLYETLKTEWNKKNPNLNKCGEILSKLKVRFSSDTARLYQNELFIQERTLNDMVTVSVLANVS